MIRWIKANAKVCFIAFTIGFILAVFTAPRPAAAMEINSAWPCRMNVLASTAADTIRLYAAGEDSSNVKALPAAYMVWEKHGNEISFRRFFEGTAEPVWIGIPDGQSLVIPAPRAQKLSGKWMHVLSFYGAAGDSILYLPLNR